MPEDGIASALVFKDFAELSLKEYLRLIRALKFFDAITVDEYEIIKRGPTYEKIMKQIEDKNDKP